MQRLPGRSGFKAVSGRRSRTARARTRGFRSPIASLLGLVGTHHNRIQFFGYEAANLLLIWQKSGDREAPLGGLAYEALAALAFLFGSASIYLHHPERWPAGLVHGGIGLAVGGLFLLLAGYPLTGLAVVLASLETVRGGLKALSADVTRCRRKTSWTASPTLAIGRQIFGLYLVPMETLCRRFGRLGRFLNDRPFLTSALIKLPLRLEFVVKNLLQGDLVGVTVGLSWMILGDGAQAFNDPELRRSALRYAEATSAPARRSSVKQKRPARRSRTHTHVRERSA